MQTGGWEGSQLCLGGPHNVKLWLMQQLDTPCLRHAHAFPTPHLHAASPSHAKRCHHGDLLRLQTASTKPQAVSYSCFQSSANPIFATIFVKFLSYFAFLIESLTFTEVQGSVNNCEVSSPVRQNILQKCVWSCMTDLLLWTTASRLELGPQWPDVRCKQSPTVPLLETKLSDSHSQWKLVVGFIWC